VCSVAFFQVTWHLTFETTCLDGLGVRDHENTQCVQKPVISSEQILPKAQQYASGHAEGLWV
jgi:hypothetical protein